MKNREIQCKFYECEGKCLKGREGTFYGSCQHCTKYQKKMGARPNRVDTRKRKIEKYMKHDRDFY